MGSERERVQQAGYQIYVAHLVREAALAGELDPARLDAHRLASWRRTLKRLGDILGAALLLVLLSPLLVLIALLIRLQTGYSPFFCQQRVGLRGRVFTLYKFRTMFPDADPYALSPTSADDPRITRIGRWLRRHALDEALQLLNVFKGDMSFVGPRPQMSFEVDAYELWQRRRLDVPPGLTGFWQLMGHRNAPATESIQYDFYYIRHRSVALDLWILWFTIRVIMGERGAG